MGQRRTEKGGRIAPLVVFGGIGLISIIGVIIVAVTHLQRDEPYLDSKRIAPGEQTEKQAYEIWCSTHNRMPGYYNLNAAERGRAVSTWWDANIANEKARAAIMTATENYDTAADQMRAAAKRAGLRGCDFADKMFDQAPRPTAP